MKNKYDYLFGCILQQKNLHIFVYIYINYINLNHINLYIFLILTFKVINITIFIRGQIKIFIKKNSLKSNIYNNIQY